MLRLTRCLNQSISPRKVNPEKHRLDKTLGQDERGFRTFLSRRSENRPLLLTASAVAWPTCPNGWALVISSMPDIAWVVRQTNAGDLPSRRHPV